MDRPVYIVQSSIPRLNKAFEHSRPYKKPQFLLTSWGMNNTSSEHAEYKQLNDHALLKLSIPVNQIHLSPIGIDRVTSFIGIRKFMLQNPHEEYILPIEDFYQDNYMELIHTLYPFHSIKPLTLESNLSLQEKLKQLLMVNLPISMDRILGKLDTIEKQNNYLENINNGNIESFFQGVASVYFSEDIRKSHRKICEERFEH